MPRRPSRASFPQIADDLRKRIASGEFAPENRLPPMRVLASEYEVAGATMDRALDLLKDERILESRIGSGTFILERPAHLWSSSSVPYLTARPRGERDAWSEQTDAKGRVGSQDLVEVSEVEPPSTVSRALRLQARDPAVLRRRLVYLDGVAVEIADSYYPTAIARGTPLAVKRKIKGGTVTALADLGYRTAGADEEVSARMPTADERETLAMEEGEPVLVQWRVSNDREGKTFEVSVMTMPAARRRLKYSIRLD